MAAITCAILFSSSASSDAEPSSYLYNAVINERSLQSRVLGGDDAESGAWPSIVALLRPGLAPRQHRLFCGGTVVAEHWVLTAAHCVLGPSHLTVEPDAVRVVAGITNLATQTATPEIPIVSIIIHPDYDPLDELPPHDIALLELQDPVDVVPVVLFSGETEQYSSRLAHVAGWGATSYDNDIPRNYPTALQDAAVPLVSNEQCNAPESYAGLIRPQHLCAGYVDGLVDACAGDSGGPLYLIESGVQQLLGITSFGNGCALPLFYGVYTNVSHYLPWLANYINVPYQSPELIASREVLDGVSPSAQPQAVTGSSRSFLGATTGLLPWLVLVVLWRLRLRCYPAELKS